MKQDLVYSLGEYLLRRIEISNATPTVKSEGMRELEEEFNARVDAYRVYLAALTNRYGR